MVLIIIALLQVGAHRVLVMSSFSRLIRFQSASNGKIYFADLGVESVGLPSLKAYSSIEHLAADIKGINTSIGKV